MFTSQRVWWAVRAAAFAGLLVAVGRAGPVRAHTPESPEVQAMIKRATDFLLKSATAGHGPGGDALVGLALFKAGYEPTHPAVASAIAAAQRFGQGVAHNGSGEQLLWRSPLLHSAVRRRSPTL